MRVLMLLENQPYPQDVRVLHEARALTEAGHEVTVICPRAPGQGAHDLVDGVRVRRYRLRPAGRRAVGYLWEYPYAMAASLLLSVRVLAGGGFDVVHAHNPPDTFVVIGALYKRLGKRFVFDHHDLVPEMFAARFGREPSRLLRRVLVSFERWSLRAADLVISTNASHRETALARGGVRAERIAVVRNGPDLDGGPRLREAAPRPGVTIGYVGTIGVHDGVEYLLRALAHLVHDLRRQDLTCAIAGSGEQLPALRRLARELELDGHVSFKGWLGRADVDCFLEDIDIGVEPAPRNAYNERCTMIKVLEYMAARKPVVGFDLHENRVSAGDAALFVAVDDHRELAGAIASLADDPELRDQLGARGRKRIEEGLAWSVSAHRLVKAYEALAAHSMLSPVVLAPPQPEPRADAADRIEPGPSIPGAGAEDARYLGERYLSTAPRAGLLKAYYRAKPVIPRRAQSASRRLLGRRRLDAGLVAWPIEDVLLRQRGERLARELVRTGEERRPFVNYWPQGARFACTLTHDVEGVEGLEQIPALLEVEQRHGFRSSWNFVAEWYPLGSDHLALVRQAGCEVGLHGIRHDGTLFLDRASFEASLPRIRHYMSEWQAVGFRSPSTYRNADWMHELPCLYDSSYPQNDPWQPQPGGCCSILPFFFGEVVELPITLDQDHTLFDLLGADSIGLWVRKTRWLVEHHGLVNLIVHPDYMTEERLRHYEEFLVFLKGLAGGWHALPGDVARWWSARSRLMLAANGEGDPVVTGPAATRASVAWARPAPGGIAYEP